MQSPSIQAANDINDPLFPIPVELITNIFNLLPSLSDVLALAATCRRLRRIWTMNVTTIYSHVATRSIPCERHARRFLADQGGPATDYPTLSASDVICMLRNSCVVEKAMLQFEKDIVHLVKTKGVPTEIKEKYYGPGALKHPPHLTRRERRRFTRSYYQLWGMMSMDPGKWQSRVESMILKQLYEVYEISKLWQSIGREEVRPAQRFADARPGSLKAINRERSKERVALAEKIWQYIEQTFQRFYHREAENDFWGVDDLYEGTPGYIVMWDHWQPTQKFILCGRQRWPSTPRPSFEKQYFWEDSSEEEVET